MEIRKLVESDYDQVIELYTQLDEFHVQARPDCFVQREKDKIYPKDAFIHNLAYPGLDLGAFDGNLLVGIVRATLWEESIMRKDLKTVCLDDIYVLPTYRRRGIAAKLFAEVEAWAREQGVIRLDLHTFFIEEIIGKTVIIHSDPDDFRTQPSGNAGTKIACGVIQKVY